MALVRWNPTLPGRPASPAWSPFEGMESLRAEMDRIFDSYFGTAQPSTTREVLWAPRVDLVEHEKEFVLVADLPGMQQEDIDISVQNNVLTLQGKRIMEHVVDNSNGGAHYRERMFGTFCRRFPLGVDVDAEQITATYKAGVLEVHLPKTATAQPKRIAVHAAS